jgi:signal transduction histidine kinase
MNTWLRHFCLLSLFLLPGLLRLACAAGMAATPPSSPPPPPPPPPILHIHAAERTPLPLLPWLGLLEDRSTRLGITEIQQQAQRFRYSPAANLNLGLTRSAWWLRLEVVNDSSESQTRLLEMAHPLTSSIDFWQFDANGSSRHLHTGHQTPFASRPYIDRNFVFPVTLAAGQSRVLYFRLQSIAALDIAARLWTFETLRLDERQDYATHALFLGMVLAMALFNALLYLALRDRVYLLYVGFTACVALVLMTRKGLGKEFLWPNHAWWPEMSMTMAYGLALLTLIALTCAMLGTRALLPRLDRALLVVASLIGLNLLATLLSPGIFPYATPILALLSICLIFSGSLYGTLQKQRSALFFVVAFSMLMFGSLLNILRVVGWLPTNFWTSNGMQIGSALEMLLLAFALADRFNALRRQKSAAELNAVRSQNQMLETQAQLLQSEKMAALGQLVASISHEINTPIAAVKASGENMSDALQHALKNMPLLLGTLDSANVTRFVALIEHAILPVPFISSREERELARQTSERLSQAGLANARKIAATLVQLHAHQEPETWLPLLQHQQAGLILETANNMAILIQNTGNINRAVERVGKILRALKTFSRFDQQAAPVEVSLQENLETILTLYQGQLKQGIEVVREYETIAPLPLLADEINQVWTNLLHNALQAMNNHGTLTLGIRRSGDEAVVSIKDSGCGIPEAIRGQVFDAFFTTKASGEGSGLGLDIVRRIVEKHHGRITLESEIGVGTTFFVSLPYHSTPPT